MAHETPVCLPTNVTIKKRHTTHIEGLHSKNVNFSKCCCHQGARDGGRERGSLDGLVRSHVGQAPRSPAGMDTPMAPAVVPGGSCPHCSCPATAAGVADHQTRTLRKTGSNYLAMSHLPLIIDYVPALPHLISLNPMTKASSSQSAGGKASSRVSGPGSARPQGPRGGAPFPSLGDGHRATRTRQPVVSVCSELAGHAMETGLPTQPVGHGTRLWGPLSDLAQFCTFQRHGPK